MADKIQVVVIDDHPLFREGVATTLESAEGIEVVGQGSSAEDALRLARDAMPDVLLLDVSMAGGGINAARAIAGAYPVIKIIMLTVSEKEEDVFGSLKAGARGYILKGVAARELVRIVKAVHAGESYVTPSLAASLLTEWSGEGSPARGPNDPLGELTERERDILELLATGSSNKEIATGLGLSEKTVKHYVTNSCRNCRSATGSRPPCSPRRSPEPATGVRRDPCVTAPPGRAQCMVRLAAGRYSRRRCAPSTTCRSTPARA